MQNYKLKFKNLFVLLLLLFTIHYSLFTREASAHCPLCVAGAGFGLSLSGALGIDDSITGVWIAALLGATAFWTANMIKRQFLPLQREFVYLGIFILTIWSFYRANIVNIHAGQIAGLDKLTFGMIAGGMLFYLVDIADNLIIKKAGKVFFPYQRLVFSLLSVLVLSFAIYILINYYI